MLEIYTIARDMVILQRYVLSSVLNNDILITNTQQNEPHRDETSQKGAVIFSLGERKGPIRNVVILLGGVGNLLHHKSTPLK